MIVAQDLEMVRKYRISHVLNMAPMDITTTQEYYAADRISFKAIDSKDEYDYNVMEHWEEARAFIDEGINKEGRILVHCQAGINRSGAIALAFMMWKRYVHTCHFWVTHRPSMPNHYHDVFEISAPFLPYDNNQAAAACGCCQISQTKTISAHYQLQFPACISQIRIQRRSIRQGYSATTSLFSQHLPRLSHSYGWVRRSKMDVWNKRKTRGDVFSWDVCTSVSDSCVFTCGTPRRRKMKI